MMQLVLPPELENFVQRQLDSGKYSDTEDLVLAALKLLQHQEENHQGRLIKLQQDIYVGLEDVAQGRVVDGPTAMAKIKADLQARYEPSSE